ncbi:hypothetical protein D3C71_1280290 [compost metagenome]
MTWIPAINRLTSNVAWPLTIVATPTTVLPLRKVTIPPGPAPTTCDVNEMVSSLVALLLDALMLIDVGLGRVLPKLSFSVAL